MGVLNKTKIKEIMRQEYRRRLLETVNETDVFDDEGNLVIGKDLKVRHKKSQYEYTVDDVLEDPESGDVQIALRMPEEPRMDPEPEGEEIMTDTPTSQAKVLGEQDPAVSSDPEEEIFFIDQEEFEKEYEVK